MGWVISSADSVLSISRWWCPTFGFSTPEGATPMFGLSPKMTLNGLVTVSPFLRFTKYECAPSGAFDCVESDCVAAGGVAAGGVVDCWADAGPIRAASVATVRTP